MSTPKCATTKKYAYLTDYVRLIVVQNYGGIYFDTDVEAVRNFDDLLDNIAFFGFETNEYVNTGLGFGAEKENEVVKQMIREYDHLLDGKNGYLCNVKDGEDLYCKIKQFIELPYEKRREMGRYARKFVAENFNKTDVVNKTIKEIGL